MIPEQLIKTTIAANTKKYYSSIGFDQKSGDEIFVSPNQLMDNSSVIEERVCDCCGERYKGPHQKMIKSFIKFNADYCPNCVKNDSTIRQYIIDKRKRTNNIIYGCDAPAQNAEVHSKIFKTNQEKYGVNSTLELAEVQDKIKQAMIEKYGVTNPMQNIEIKEKAQNTNLQRYGAKNPMQNKEVLKKAQKTNLKKYGFKTSALNPEVKKKMLETLISNNNTPTSSQQVIVFEMVKELYPSYTCELNYQLSSLILDTYLKYDEVLIDIEYDGSYWHQNLLKDYARDCVVKGFGYKILRIRGGKNIPSKEELFNAIEELKNSDKTFKEIILPDWKN